MASSMEGQGFGDRLRFAASGFRTGSGDDGQFIKDEGRVLDEDRVGVFVQGGEHDDLASQVGQGLGVVLMLAPGGLQINGRAFDVGQFAGTDRIRDGTDDCNGV